MNPYKTLPTFKVLEVNQSVGQFTGHMIAQVPFEGSTKVVEGTSYVENGYIMYLTNDNGELKLVTPAGADKAVDTPFIHYTEELFDGISNELKHFALEADDTDPAISYPRAIALYVGDTYTTNNLAAGADVVDGLYYVTDEGQFTNTKPEAYTGPVFHGLESTLPDAETDAVELTYIGIQ